MVTMTCKCGATSKTFLHLKFSDFPKVWEQDCCAQALPLPVALPAFDVVEVLEEPVDEAPAEAPKYKSKRGKYEPKA